MVENRMGSMYHERLMLYEGILYKFAKLVDSVFSYWKLCKYRKSNYSFWNNHFRYVYLFSSVFGFLICKLPTDNYEKKILFCDGFCWTKVCFSFRSPEWFATSLWGRCSPPCGPGLQTKVFACVETDKFNTTKLRPDRLCGPLPPHLLSNATRECNWGDCNLKTWWRTSNWSSCSQQCGNLGYTSREVECVMSGEEGEIALSHKFENDFCNPNKRPESRGSCNQFNCPAEFQALEWQKVSYLVWFPVVKAIVFTT